MKDKRLMIIDGLNIFKRSLSASRALSTSGTPVGGLVGFLNSLQKCIRLIKPDEVVIVWDGPGGSTRRRKIFENYKDGRKPIKINKYVTHLSSEQEEYNMVWQQSRLLEYLNNFPIMQFLEEQIEADDLIAFVGKQGKYADWVKVIVSSDKDFFQLCDKTTVIYRPIQDKVLSWKNIVEEYNIHPNNFTMARAMEGDKSDNIKGVKGVGLKSVKKYLPFLAEEKTYYFEDIEDYCREKIREGAKVKFYSSVVDNMEMIRQNYKGMQLYVPSISAQVAQKTRNCIEKFEYHFNHTNIVKMFFEDKIGAYNYEEMYRVFKRIVVENK